MAHHHHLGESLQRRALWQTGLLMTAALAVVLTFQACGDFHANNHAVHETALKSLSCDQKLGWAFETGMHKFLSRHCSACHSGHGTAPGNFADRAVGVAYADFAGLGYGTSFTKWELVKRNATDDLTNHQGVGGSHLAGSFFPASELWELGLQNYSQECEDRPLPQRTEEIFWVTEEEPGTYENRTLSLENLSGGLSLPGSELRFQTTITDTAPFAYVLRNLRMKNGDRPVRVQSVSVYLNGNLVPSATTFITVDVELEPGEEVSLTLEGASPLYVQAPPGLNPSEGTLALEFESIEFLD